PRGRAVHYLAVDGGIDVPEVLGARATLVSAGFGGYDGRPLARRDVVAVGPPLPRAGSPCRVDLDRDAPIEVTPGPHFERFSPDAFEALLSIAWRVSRLGDRVGVRLEGGSIPRATGAQDRGPPVPMLRGAVQITSDGTPIVFGPDHPATGGYPVLALVR